MWLEGDEGRHWEKGVEAMSKIKNRRYRILHGTRLHYYHCSFFSLLPFKNAHQDFSKMKQSNNESNLREEVLKNLAVANDKFVELVANLKEGTKVK